MQAWPLVTGTLLRHAARHHGEQTLISIGVDGVRTEQTLLNTYVRCVRLALALERLTKVGEVCATLAWNTHRHIEAWHAVQSSGRVLHTLNPRLSIDQLAFIASEGEDAVLLVDTDLVPLAEQLVAKVRGIRAVVVLAFRQQMPRGSGTCQLLCYEDLLTESIPPDDLFSYQWAGQNENARALLCFTSGTTGSPKGVAYSHRSQVLHAMMVGQPDVCCLKSTDSLLLIVPCFHANGWGLPFASMIAGCQLVLPGPRLDGLSIQRLIATEGCTVSAAVPTVWYGLLQHLRSSKGTSLAPLKRVIIGGAATSEALLVAFEKEYGVEVQVAYGMTETSPLMTLNKAKHGAPRDLVQKLKAGRCMFTVDVRIVDDSGNPLPWDGMTSGHLQAKGPGVLRQYLKMKPLDDGAWFETGDIATIDKHGYVQIVDRSKDVVKSGGEFLSSVELENEAMGVGTLAGAACIGVPDERWGERPVLIAVASPGVHVTEESVLAHLRSRLAKWSVPDRVIFVDAIPLTSVGKIDKKELRSMYAKLWAKEAAGPGRAKL